MNTDQMSGSLMFMTFGAVLIAIIASIFWFLRIRSNREAMKRALDIDPN